MSSKLGIAKQSGKQEQYYEIGFLLKGQSQWGSGHTLATDEQSAIVNFLSDFSPDMGTLVAVLAHLNDETSLLEFKKLFKPVAA